MLKVTFQAAIPAEAGISDSVMPEVLKKEKFFISEDFQISRWGNNKPRFMSSRPQEGS
ncbi:hypothetical protein BH23BAC1_BH23BAC1_51480 [soil metagenome]